MIFDSTEVRKQNEGEKHARNESHDRKTGSCKMITMNLNLMTTSDIISRSLHTHFQASA